MTLHRSLIPSGSLNPSGADDDAPPPTMPMLPYACLAYAEHCSRDYAVYIDRLTQADEPLAAQQALSLTLISDMNQAFYSLLWAPIGAIMSQARP